MSKHVAVSPQEAADFVVYMDAKDPKPTQELHFREELAPGGAYTFAHHLTVDGAKRRLMIAALRYDDTSVKKDGTWLFAERKLHLDWIEERALS